MQTLTDIDLVADRRGAINSLAILPTDTIRPAQVLTADCVNKQSKINEIIKLIYPMLVKFECKSSRVKGLAFHPKRPWILVSFHNGSVQIWDYRMGTVVDKYDDHEGPVRGCAFHPSQPLFVTGGDDGKVRVYNYQQRRCLFTLSGHMDYIRTVFFHHESPWIVSSSDDQTIRVWNWQSRSCIAVLTGHSHYVMCAQFHPKDDLIVSASLDQTIRVWDIGNLRRRHSSAGTGATDSYRPTSPRTPQIDLFGAPEGQVKFILEGHDRGVNWVQFHPTRPIIVSASDDRSIKLWRYNEGRAWETDTFRGHFNNVSCVLFHPRAELLISNSEDKTIRIWEYNKRGSQPTIFRRDADRFWTLAAHPEANLLAAGHDGGYVIFKLEHERPLYVVAEDILYYVKESALIRHDLKSQKEKVITNVSSKASSPAILSYSSSEQKILMSSNRSGSYLLVSVAGAETEPKAGAGSFAAFTARNRFAVFDVNEESLTIKALDNSTVKSIALPDVSRVLPAATGTVLLAKDAKVQLFDIQTEAVVEEWKFPGLKYAVWSPDYSKVALLGKNSISIAERSSSFIKATIEEASNIKSAVWDHHGILFYTTHHQVKYILPNGDSGVICTIPDVAYIIKVDSNSMSAIDRLANLSKINIDPTEYLFKLALCRNDMAKVTEIIEGGRLIGQSTISYLRNSGYADLALQFVSDPATLFELAIESCNMAMAKEAAEQLDKVECWKSLADEAMRMGNFRLVEYCYQKTGNTMQLAFLYLLMGEEGKLERLRDGLEHGNGRLLASLWLKDVPEIANSFKHLGLNSLCCLAMKSNGLDTSEFGHFAEDQLRSFGVSSLSRIAPQTGNAENWPLTGELTSYVRRNEPSETGTHYQTTSKGAAFEIEHDVGVGQELANDWESEQAIQGLEIPVDEEDIGVWGGYVDELGTELPTPITKQKDLGGKITDFIGGGDYESAINIIQQKAKVKKFKALEPLFLRITQSSSFLLKPFDDREEILPHISSASIISWENIDTLLTNALNLTTSGKFSEAIPLFRQALATACLFADTAEYEENAPSVKVTCREYILGLAMEQKRKDLLARNPADPAVLRLACLFASRDLKDDHKVLALRSALAQSYKSGYYKLSAKIAKALMSYDVPDGTRQQVESVHYPAFICRLAK